MPWWRNRILRIADSTIVRPDHFAMLAIWRFASTVGSIETADLSYAKARKPLSMSITQLL